MSSFESLTLETTRPAKPGSIIFFITLSAFFFFERIKTRFPSARKCPIIFATVCVFPVPGGPSTSVIGLS